MKFNSKVAELLCDLSDIETPENSQLLAEQGNDLTSNLLELYRVTDNSSSKLTINAIMAEAGYPTLDDLDSEQSISTLQHSAIINAPSTSLTQTEHGLLSEDDFLDLLPANCYFH